MAAEGTDTYEPTAPAKPNPTRIILLVEGTAAATISWRGTRKWLDTILHLMEKEYTQEPQESGTAPQDANSKPPKYQYALIVYGTHDRSTPAPVQSSGWTSNLPQLFTWLDGIQFVGGVTSKGTALTHALAEAIMLSKSPYPGGARPAPAAATHPAPLSLSDTELVAHTHLIVVCPSFNPCRLPVPWPCTPDTKAALAAAKFYPPLLEKCAAIQQDKSDRNIYGMFGQLEFIKGSLQAYNPGCADVWDLTISLARHRLSLSVISGRAANTRTCVEFFAYGNYCLSGLKAACMKGLMAATGLSVSVYLSPTFTDAQRTFKPIMLKLLQQAKKRQVHAQQQHQQQQQAQQATAATQPQQQQQQQAQQQQQQPQQQPQQQQQQAHLQQWPAATPGGASTSTAVSTARVGAAAATPQSAGGSMPAQAAALAAAQQRAGAVPAGAGVAAAQQQGATQQAQQQQQQQVRHTFPGMPVAAGMAVGQQQQQQQPQQQPVLAAGGALPGAMGMAINTAQTGLLQQQQQQLQQQAQPQVVTMVMPQAGMQAQTLMGLQQHPMQMAPGYTQQAQMPLAQQQLLQQQQQQQQQQQVQPQMAGGMQIAAQMTSGAAAAKQDKQRVGFWRGNIYINMPDSGMLSQLLAEVELSSSSGASMVSNWSHRSHITVHQIVPHSSLKQQMHYTGAQQAAGNKVTRVYYKVVKQHPAFAWLQSQVMARDDKQVILLGQLNNQLKGLLVFGWQTVGQRQGATPTSINLLEGALILSGIGA